jgi:Mg2+ and Co2+ transporter CorA
MKWDVAERLVQTERTLDEAYYPSLDEEALKARNKDQVVSRECKKSLKGERVSDDTRPILMVPQFWIWKFEDHILSAYSCPGTSPEMLCEYEFDKTLRYSNCHTDLRLDPFDSIHWKNKNIGLSTKLLAPPDLFIGLLLAHQIDKFGQAQAGQFQSPLDIFEIGAVQAMSSVERYMSPNASTKLDIIKEAKFMHRISDIRSELAMIQTILDNQAKVLKSVIDNASTKAKEDPAWRRVGAAPQQIENYCIQLRKIDGDAERIEKIIQDQLNLKRTHASIQDARTSLLLGAAVSAFTIITVIFTPLSFMTSLFALPIHELLNHTSGDSKSYSTNYVGKWFGKWHQQTQHWYKNKKANAR